jgi:hypothetical protein
MGRYRLSFGSLFIFFQLGKQFILEQVLVDLQLVRFVDFNDVLGWAGSDIYIASVDQPHVEIFISQEIDLHL